MRDLPLDVEVLERRHEDGTRFTIAINHTAADARIPAGDHDQLLVPAGGVVTLRSPAGVGTTRS